MDDTSQIRLNDLPLLIDSRRAAADKTASAWIDRGYNTIKHCDKTESTTVLGLYLLLDDALKPATPLTNGVINQTLLQCPTQWHFTR